MISSKISDTDKLIELVASTSLFRSLDASQIESLLSSGKLSLHGRGKVLFHQGDVVEHLYLILEGSIKTFRTSECGDEAILQLLHPGNTFMEAFIFLYAPSPMSAQVVKDATLLTISASVARKFACTDSYFAQNLLKVISEQHKESMLKIESILLRSPVQRIGYYLLNLLVEAGSAHSTIKLTHQKSLIAGHLGMKPETLSRALAELKKLGVNVEGDEITLPTVFSLCLFCDTDTTLKCQKVRSQECRLKPWNLPEA